MSLSQSYRENWSLPSKLIFRLVTSYLALYIILMFLSPLMEIPFRWIGTTILGINYSYDVRGNGSGDNTYAYITLFVSAVLAVLVFILWSLIDKKRKSYNQLQYWFFVILRVFLVAFMLLYGIVKVFQIQFQPPSLVKLLQPLGELSPMGLAWTYMGYSKGFGIFAGAMEIIGGLLLIPKRSVTLGAFIIIGVMSQVFMMNLMFDIPVKLFSLHLVLMALVLFISDSKKFFYVFITKKGTIENQSYHPINEKGYHKIIFWIKTVFVSFILIVGSIFAYQGQQNFRAYTDKPPLLYGIWETDLFIKNSDTISPLLTAKSRWRYLIIEREGVAHVKTMNDILWRYTFEIDSTHKKISMFKQNDTKDSLNLTYRFIDNKYTIQIKGRLENDSIEVKLTHKDLANFPLKTRGFHWINERPYNL